MAMKITREKSEKTAEYSRNVNNHEWMHLTVLWIEWFLYRFFQNRQGYYVFTFPPFDDKLYKSEYGKFAENFLVMEMIYRHAETLQVDGR
jgi:hypothetical protein